MQHPAPVGEHDVGDDLFEARVEFGGGTRHEEIVFPREDGCQVARHVEVQTLERAEPVEERATDHQHHFFASWGGHRRG